MIQSASAYLAAAFVLAATGSIGQMPAVSLRLNDDATPSGFAGAPVRVIEPGTTPEVTILGPVGHSCFLFAGLHLEPGFPVPGSAWPVHLMNFIDVTFILGNASGVVIPEDHIIDGVGRVETGVLIPPLMVSPQIVLQAAAVNAALTQVLLSNPVEIILPGGPAGSPASLAIHLVSSVVEEQDEGGVLTVVPVVRDAAGRTISPPPPFTMSTNAAGATSPSAGQIAFPTQGAYDVSVAITGTPLASSASLRVVPEVISGAFVSEAVHFGGLSDTGQSALRSLAGGNSGAVSAALAALSNGLQPGNLPPISGGSGVLMPLCSNYPSLAQLIASGNFPSNPDDSQLPAFVANLSVFFQQAANFVNSTPLGTMTLDELARLGSRAQQLKDLVDQFNMRNFSSRAYYAQLTNILSLLNQILPNVLRTSIDHARAAIADAQAAYGFGRSLATAYRHLGLGGIALEIYKPLLRELGSMAAQMALHSLINYALQNIANLNLCMVCSTGCLAGCSGVVPGCSVEFNGSGFGLDPACHRILVLTTSSGVSPTISALSGQDTIPDLFQAIANLQILFGSHFFSFAPDLVGSYPFFCGPSLPLTLNSWPLSNTSPFGIPQPIDVLVLRLDAGITNSYQLLQF